MLSAARHSAPLGLMPPNRDARDWERTQVTLAWPARPVGIFSNNFLFATGTG
jgi:hypothetical protein